MTGKADWVSFKSLRKKYSSLYTKHCLITMKNVKQWFYLMLSKIAVSPTHNVNINGTQVISCCRTGFLFTENVHFSPFTFKIFSVEEPVKTALDLHIWKIYIHSAAFLCHSSWLYKIVCFQEQCFKYGSFGLWFLVTLYTKWYSGFRTNKIISSAECWRQILPICYLGEDEGVDSSINNL